MALPLILAGAGLATNIVSKWQAGRQANKAERAIEANWKEGKSFYDREYNKDFLDTSVAKSVSNRIKANARTQGEAANNAAARGGATADQATAQKAQVQKTSNDAIAKVAGMGTQYKAGLRNDYMRNLRDYTNAKVGINQQRAESWMNVAENAGNLATAGLEAAGNSDTPLFGKKKTA